MFPRQVKSQTMLEFPKPTYCTTEKKEISNGKWLKAHTQSAGEGSAALPGSVRGMFNSNSF